MGSVCRVAVICTAIGIFVKRVRTERARGPCTLMTLDEVGQKLLEED